jgi:hypothetical protein
MFHSIKRVVDTNILNEMISSSKRKKKSEKNKTSADDDDSHFNYANSALTNSTLMITYHSLMNNVIYDSSCSHSLIFDKTRFVNEDLISSNDQIKISDDHMQIEEYEIMRVWRQLKSKKIEITFKKTAYISNCSVTLVSQSKLEKEEFDRDSFIKTLIHLKTSTQVCEIQRRFEMQLLEYTLISRDDQMMTNSMQSSRNIIVKAISWQWHRRLEHCRSQMIDHLSKEWITSNADNEVFKTIKCQICAVSKMHKLVQRQSSAKTIKFYEMLHFDLIIYEMRDFDSTICITHFTNKFTHYSWIFSLNDHREKTLMLVFKELINKCDRSDIAINSMMRIIKSSQETSINKHLENWITNQSIIWDWSAKNIFEQNDTSKRYEALLIEKTKCIREHAKLSENLFLECYLTIEHLMNRTLNQILNWDSLLIRMQKLINQNQSIRPEIEHLKMYECKTYSLLKKADVSSRDSKLKSRAFVDYLIDYNSTNIFRVWNPEKDDVNDYRDVIFDESELYDIYNKNDSIVTLEKEKRIVKISINQTIALNSENDEWLEISIRNRLMLKNKRVVELSTSSSKESSKKKSSQKRSSRSFTLVSSQSLADLFTNYSSLSKSSSLESKIHSKRDSSLMNLTDRILEMRRKCEIKRNVISADLDEANILEGKRVKFASSKYLKFDYAQLAWIEDEWNKISEFHVAFMIELMKLKNSLIKNQIDFQIDLKKESSIIDTHIDMKVSNRTHISTLSSSSAHWRAMLKHLHEDEFRKTAQMKYDAIDDRDTWEIVNKSENQKIISLKWMFIYKNDSDDYLIKYKARIMMRNDLQNADSQDVYAATLTSKIFRMLMILVIAFHLKTRQLNVVNAFLNAHNDELVYCQMFDDYRLQSKCYRIIRALYDQRKSSLLWLRILIIKCLELRLKSIFEESCLFIADNVIMFFYVNDIVFAYRTNRKRVAESYIARLKSMFEMRDMKSIKFFLEIRVIQTIDSIYLVQDTYIDKLVKNYKININSKASFTSLSIEDIESFKRDVDLNRMHEYHKKMRSVCYSVVIS